jgi:hypothetical protein
MKIVHILGRGLEGCGVTRYALEFHEWAKRNGHESYLVALKKSWTVGSKIKKDLSDLYDLSAEEFDANIDEMLSADLVITHSFPPSSSDENSIIAWENLLDSPRQCRLVHSCLDHKPMSWARNHDFFNGVAKHDKLSLHAPEGKLVQKLRRLGHDIPITQSILGYTFGDPSRWMPCKDQQRRVAYVGRYATFKDPGRMIPLHELIGEQHDIEVTMMGIARVVESAWIRGHDGCRSMEESMGKRDMTRLTDKVGVYREYPHKVGMDYIRETAVCSDFYELDFYSPGMEFAMFEIIDQGSCLLVGSKYLTQAPVWKHDGVIGEYIEKTLALDAAKREVKTFTVQGLKSSKDVTMKVTTEVPAVQAQKIAEAVNDPNYREEMRREWFDHASTLYSSDVVYPDTLERFMS